LLTLAVLHDDHHLAVVDVARLVSDDIGMIEVLE
jgi:hypothetical protein